MNIFERASRNKLRFTTRKGALATEDLWDLNLETLDSIAKSIHKQLKEEDDVSFIEPKTKTNLTVQLQMDIVKHVIEAKITQREAGKKRAETMAQIDQINEILQRKQVESLASKSTDELAAMLSELKG